MIGMVLVTHGRLAAEFAAALEHVVGAQAQIASVCIGPEDDMEQRRQDILRSIAEVDSGDGAVLLTDMFGGTPSNLAISVMDRGKIEVIAGVNLPTLIKLVSLRQNEGLERSVSGAQEALDLLPHAELQVLPATGFLMAYDDPVSLARELIAFCG